MREEDRRKEGEDGAEGKVGRENSEDGMVGNIDMGMDVEMEMEAGLMW